MADNARCITPSKPVRFSSMVNSKSHMVSFRLSNEAYSKIQTALACPSNCNSSTGDYCKQVVERHAFRHDKRKYKER